MVTFSDGRVNNVKPSAMEVFNNVKPPAMEDFNNVKLSVMEVSIMLNLR